MRREGRIEPGSPRPPEPPQTRRNILKFISLAGIGATAGVVASHWEKLGNAVQWVKNGGSIDVSPFDPQPESTPKPETEAKPTAEDPAAPSPDILKEDIRRECAKILSMMGLNGEENRKEIRGQAIEKGKKLPKNDGALGLNQQTGELSQAMIRNQAAYLVERANRKPSLPFEDVRPTPGGKTGPRTMEYQARETFSLDPKVIDANTQELLADALTNGAKHHKKSKGDIAKEFDETVANHPYIKKLHQVNPDKILGMLPEDVKKEAAPATVLPDEKAAPPKSNLPKITLPRVP